MNTDDREYAGASAFMDGGLRRDDGNVLQAASPSAASGADWPSSQDWNINIAQS